MASLIIATGSATHPQISIDKIDLAGDQITFRWVDGPYSGDCSETFAISLAEHGDLTLNQLAEAVTVHMIGLLG